MQVENVSEKLSKSKEKLEILGLSIRAAAPLLGCSFQHLAEVLRGRRESKRLLEKINNLTKPKN